MTNRYVKKSVQLVKGSSFRNDLLQNPYFKKSQHKTPANNKNSVNFGKCGDEFCRGEIVSLEYNKYEEWEDESKLCPRPSTSQNETKNSR